MARDPNIRASDVDRDRTAAALREHMAEGRLTNEEFDERLDKVYAAKTLGDLDGLMADLPRTDLAQPADVSLHGAGSSPPVPEHRSDGSVQASGASGGLWFLWVPGIMGVLLLGRWISGGPAHHAHRPDRPRRHHRDRDSDY